jgi:FtsH-binding integral membrane protein
LTRPAQKALITLAFAGAIGLVIVSVLDHRFGWSQASAWVSILGNILWCSG